MSQRQRGRRPVQEITEPQRRTLKEIRLFTNRRGFPPTMKELADILGISHASAHGQVSQLVRKGYLKREARKARGIVILRDPEDDVPDLVAVPIISRVAAGQPILAEENIIGEMLVEGGIARAGRCFALEVTGDSMVDAGIRERGLQAREIHSNMPADEPGRRRRLTSDMVVQNEIISHFIEQEYLDPMDDAVIDDLVQEFQRRGLDPEALGLSRENLRQRLIQARTRESMEPRETPVTPQRRRQEARRRLNERSRALASRILNALGASINGRNIVLAYPELRSANNYAAVIMIVNGAVNERLEADGGTRGDISLERLEEVLEQIDRIGDDAQAQIQDRLSRR